VKGPWKGQKGTQVAVEKIGKATCKKIDEYKHSVVQKRR
jgi:hypothetical protein